MSDNKGIWDVLQHTPDKGPVINYSEGVLQNGKNVGMKGFAPPTLMSRQGKPFHAPTLLKGGNVLSPGGRLGFILDGMCELNFLKRPILKVFNMLKLYP